MPKFEAVLYLMYKNVITKFKYLLMRFIIINILNGLKCDEMNLQILFIELLLANIHVRGAYRNWE